MSDISDGDLLQQLDQDDELIPRMAGMELTERLSTLTMYRSCWEIQSGHACAAGVGAIGRSLGAAESARQRTAPATVAGCRRRSRRCSRSRAPTCLRELSHLPNFVANQTTTRFDDSPMTLKYFQATTDQAGFHRVGNGTTDRSTFQDGKEVTDGVGVRRHEAKQGHWPGEPRRIRNRSGRRFDGSGAGNRRCSTIGSNPWRARLPSIDIRFRANPPTTKSLTPARTTCRFTTPPGTTARLPWMPSLERSCA